MPYATFLHFDVIDVAGLILPYCIVCNTNREIPDNSNGDDRQKQDNYLQKEYFKHQQQRQKTGVMRLPHKSAELEQHLIRNSFKNIGSVNK